VANSGMIDRELNTYISLNFIRVPVWRHSWVLTVAQGSFKHGDFMNPPETLRL